MSEVIVKLETNYRCDIISSSHMWRADEPKGAGGDDTGPSPYELLLGALGACTAMTLKMYAAKKDIPLEGVTVNLVHERIHREDCQDCDEDDARKRLDRITRHIVLKGEITQTQRERMLQIAAMCPVHRTITSSPHISDSIEAEGG